MDETLSGVSDVVLDSVSSVTGPGGGAVSLAKSSTDDEELDSNRPDKILVFNDSVEIDLGFTEIQMIPRVIRNILMAIRQSNLKEEKASVNS